MIEGTRTNCLQSGGPVYSARRVRACLLGLILALVPVATAHALEPIVIKSDDDWVEITTLGDLYESRGDSLQVETAPGADGIKGRVSVNAVTRGTDPHWIVFALSNPTADPVERLLTADRYNVVGSGAIWPDLDAQRIEAITPSIGYVPERIMSDRADVFRVTLDPGQTITYVAELTSDRFARIYLWKPLNYELKVRDRQLFNGILLGLTGLLAIFLTAIFAANHKLIFPAAALVAWCVLAYLCVDFGFFHKLFHLKPEDNAVYRAAAESAMAASFVIFLYVFLRLKYWNGLVRMLVSVWILAQLALVAVAVIDPRLASTFARLSFVAIGATGAFFTLFLALRGQDRALSLLPTWMLFCVWVFSAGALLTGQLSGDVAVSGLVAFLVLILVSIGFSITQFAFRTIEPIYGSAPTEAQQRSVAVEGAGAAVWEWNARRDEVNVGSAVEEVLGLKQGELSTRTEDFARHIHPADREKFKLTLWSVQERAGGRICADFRLRHADNSYRWFELSAASVAHSDLRAMRCIGLIRDVTDNKRAHERLLHDAVHDSLTGLPNRSLFLDRLKTTLVRTAADDAFRPAVFFIDIDKFKSVNSTFGLVVGDTLLLTVARRLQRHLRPHDTLARIGGDQFAMLLPGESDPQGLAGLAERARRSLRSPIKIAGQDIILTGSMGIAVYDGSVSSEHDLLKDAEIAMYRAKRAGNDRIELFRPEMRSDKDDRVSLESDLRKALEKNQFKVLYQPIYNLSTEELVGFEALVRWEHPKHGMINPTSFVPVAEESDLIVRIGSHVLLRAAHDASRWHSALARSEEPLFVSVNVSSRQLFRQDLVQEIRHILGQNVVPRGSLRLEVTESLVMENAEQAVDILGWLKSAGAQLALDDFGTGYSSLAYLQKFPIDTIKIDQSLVRSTLGSDSTGAIIVRSLVAMAHELGKTVVAEGVESAEEAAFLRSIGCECAQGFYYGEPVAQRDVIQMLHILAKSERKLRPRSFFNASRKSKSVAASGTAHEPGALRARKKSRRPQGKVAARKPGTSVSSALPASAPDPNSAPRETGGKGAGIPERSDRNAALPPPLNGAGGSRTSPPPLPPLRPSGGLLPMLGALSGSRAAPAPPPQNQSGDERTAPGSNADNVPLPTVPVRPPPLPATPPVTTVATRSQSPGERSGAEAHTGKPNGSDPRTPNAPIIPSAPAAGSNIDFSKLPPSIADSLRKLAGAAGEAPGASIPTDRTKTRDRS